MGESKAILTEVTKWMVAQLAERTTLHLPSIGELTPQLRPAYIVDEGGRTLYPPQVILTFTPDPSLLQSDLYCKVSYTPSLSSATLTEWATPISELTGLPIESLVQAMKQSLLGELTALFSGKRVTLFGLFDLYVTDDNAQLHLHYSPLPSVLSALNRPFAVYTPTPLKPPLDYPDLPHYATAREAELPEAFYPILAPPPTLSEVEKTLSEEQEIPLLPPIRPEEEVDPLPPSPPTLHRSLWWWTLPLLLLLIGAGTLFIYRQRTATPKPTEVVASAETSAPTTTIAPVTEKEATTSLAPIASVEVGRGMTLIRYAHQYYGDPIYWVYIYIANAKLIPDPDNLPLGISLTIPHLAQYKVQKGDEFSIKEAKAWGELILQRRYSSYDEQRQEIISLISSQQNL